MKVLVTGAGGFLGNAISRFAVSRGHSVAALVRSRPCRADRVIKLVGSIESPPWDEIKKFSPDVGVHCAWIATPGIYLNSPLNYGLVGASVDFARRLEALGLHKLCVLGSCAEYQWGEVCCHEENTPLAPTSLYGKSKARMRIELIETLVRTELVWARVFFPYGPGEPEDKVTTKLLKSHASARPFKLKEPGAIRDFLFVDDLAEAVICTLESQFSGVINIGSGMGIPLAELDEIAARLTGNVIPAPCRSPAGDQVVADISRLTQLGWVPKTDIFTGMRMLFESFSE